MKYCCELSMCYCEKASRLKLFTRILWMFPLMFVIWAWSIGFIVTYFIQWWSILILGRRIESFFRFDAKFHAYMTRLNAWLQLLTDQRPKLGEEGIHYVGCGECESCGIGVTGTTQAGMPAANVSSGTPGGQQCTCGSSSPCKLHQTGK